MPNPATDLFAKLKPQDRAALMAAFNNKLTAQAKDSSGQILAVCMTDFTGFEIIYRNGHWAVLKECK